MFVSPPSRATHRSGSLALTTQGGPTDVCSRTASLYVLVGVTGVEPVRPCGHWLLEPACLPFHHTPMVSGEGFEPSVSCVQGRRELRASPPQDCERRRKHLPDGQGATCQTLSYLLRHQRGEMRQLMTKSYHTAANPSHETGFETLERTGHEPYSGPHPRDEHSCGWWLRCLSGRECAAVTRHLHPCEESS